MKAIAPRFWLLPILLLASLLGLAAWTPAQDDDEEADPPAKIKPTSCLMIGSLGRAGRSPVHTDALEARLVAGDWKAPKAGDKVKRADGKERAWKKVSTNAKGAFPTGAIRGGYAYFAVELEEDEVFILEARGHSFAWLNGEIRAGDGYGNGWLMQPVELREGVNHLLFKLGRGALSMKLVRPDRTVFFNPRDPTLPDVRSGQPIDAWAGVVVVNANEQPLLRSVVQVSVGEGETQAMRVPPIPPFSFRKIPVRVKGPAPAAGATKVPVRIAIVRRARRGILGMHSVEMNLRVRGPDQPRRVTFRSKIDGSVQYYAVRPATGDDKKPKALVLSLHGAAVEAIRQAGSYGPKSWCHVVAPTNRRPFGFDWEDWGRLDALEVLQLAQAELKTDPARTYLTGHSMGGHGAWHLGVTFPDRFAVVAPSAGWASFMSYSNAPRFGEGATIEGLLRRAASPSDTMALLSNLMARPVFVLHGDQDDNVPVREARRMKKALEGLQHPALHYHEQPGVGHWWDASKDPGASCVDWPAMFALMQKSKLPKVADVRTIDFTTASPGVSSKYAWAEIHSQHRWMAPSRIKLQASQGGKRIEGTTENVRRLAIDAGALGAKGALTIALDGCTLKGVNAPGGEDRRIHLVQKQKIWAVAPAAGPAKKGPHRYGPFKQAFGNKMILVHGTDGSEEETAWALARARYDAETFAYRGNGAVDVIADVAFDPDAHPDRNVILYGNAESNAAWADLLGRSPVQVLPGRVEIGKKVLEADDLAVLFVRPRPGTERALVGVVAGTGLAGCRLTDRLPYFVSGVAYPDLTVIGSQMLEQGVKGVRVAGFFAEDWSLAGAEVVFRE